MEVGMKKGVKKQAVSEKLHVRKTSKKPIGESGNLGIKKCLGSYTWVTPMKYEKE